MLQNFICSDTDPYPVLNYYQDKHQKLKVERITIKRTPSPPLEEGYNKDEIKR